MDLRVYVQISCTLSVVNVVDVTGRWRRLNAATSCKQIITRP